VGEPGVRLRFALRVHRRAGRGTRWLRLSVGIKEFRCPLGGNLSHFADVSLRELELVHVQKMVDCDAAEPCAELCVTARLRKHLKRFEQDFLSGVLGICTPVKHAGRKVEEPRKMTCEQNLKLIAVASFCVEYEFFVGNTLGVLDKWALS